MSLFTHKRGDTFDYAGTLTLPAGVWTGAGQVRRRNTAQTLVDDLVVTLDAPTGDTAVRVFNNETSGWPVELLEFDIEFTEAGGEVLSTDTVVFKLIEDVTYDPPG